MVAANDRRGFIAIFGLTTVCLGLVTAVAAAEPTGPDVQRVRDEPAMLDKATWFAQYLAAQAETPGNSALPSNTVPQLTPLAAPDDPTAPRTVGPPIDDTTTQPPDRVSPPDISPLETPSNLLPPNPLPPDDSPPRLIPNDDTTFTLFRRSRSRASFARRRRPIAVLGDSLVDAGQMDIKYTAFEYSTWPPTPVMASASTDIPLIATAARTKVADNSSVIPMDRVMFSYHHFQNARAAEMTHSAAGDTQRILNLDRMTIGMEKTFFDGNWSLDMRLPVTSRFDVSATDFEMTNGRLGNASFLVKHLAYETDALALGLGVGIDTPTGSDGHVMLPNSQAVISNDAFHALPFLGLLVQPTDTCVLQAFAQFDIPLNGNEIEAIAPSGAKSMGQFDEQGLLFLSLSAAHWHYQDPDAPYLRGLAALLELHYTTALDDSDQVTVAASGDTYAFGNPGSIDIFNMTAGMQAQIGMTYFRAAAVVPLTGNVNKPFDAEFVLQINRRH